VLPQPKAAPSASCLAAFAMLEEFAVAGGITTDFGDVVEWQREERRDRPLPGRDE